MGFFLGIFSELQRCRAGEALRRCPRGRAGAPQQERLCFASGEPEPSRRAPPVRQRAPFPLRSTPLERRFLGTRSAPIPRSPQPSCNASSPPLGRLHQQSSGLLSGAQRLLPLKKEMGGKRPPFATVHVQRIGASRNAHVCKAFAHGLWRREAWRKPLSPHSLPLVRGKEAREGEAADLAACRAGGEPAPH